MTKADDLLSRADKLCESLEKSKTWYKTTAIGFMIAFLSFVTLSGTHEYRVSRLERGIAQAASRQCVTLLDDVYKVQNNATINLVEKGYKEALQRFEADCAKIRSNIIMWNSEINLRGTKTIANRDKK